MGLRAFLNDGGFKAFTDTFQDLTGINQLPGIAVQRLMADGYGFGGEGDWKTAALVRTMKVMAEGLTGGTSFMEDYTYHSPGPTRCWARTCWKSARRSRRTSRRRRFIRCPSAARRIRCGWCSRAPAGPAIVATVVQMGSRFRMILNEIDVVKPEHALPRFPVARALWVPKPNCG